MSSIVLASAPDARHCQNSSRPRRAICLKTIDRSLSRPKGSFERTTQTLQYSRFLGSHHGHPPILSTREWPGPASDQATRLRDPLNGPVTPSRSRCSTVSLAPVSLVANQCWGKCRTLKCMSCQMRKPIYRVAKGAA